MELRN